MIEKMIFCISLALLILGCQSQPQVIKSELSSEIISSTNKNSELSLYQKWQNSNDYIEWIKNSIKFIDSEITELKSVESIKYENLDLYYNPKKSEIFTPTIFPPDEINNAGEHKIIASGKYIKNENLKRFIQDSFNSINENARNQVQHFSTIEEFSAGLFFNFGVLYNGNSSAFKDLLKEDGAYILVLYNPYVNNSALASEKNLFIQPFGNFALFRVDSSRHVHFIKFLAPN